jgi:hypothetical protein
MPGESYPLAQKARHLLHPLSTLPPISQHSLVGLIQGEGDATLPCPKQWQYIKGCSFNGKHQSMPNHAPMCHLFIQNQEEGH